MCTTDVLGFILESIQMKNGVHDNYSDYFCVSAGRNPGKNLPNDLSHYTNDDRQKNQIRKNTLSYSNSFKPFISVCI